MTQIVLIFDIIVALNYIVTCGLGVVIIFNIYHWFTFYVLITIIWDFDFIDVFYVLYG